MHKKRSRFSIKKFCIAVLTIAIFLYGLHLYYSSFKISSSNTGQTIANVPRNTLQQKYPQPIAKDLEIPLTVIPREEQIIHHTGYTVSYNKKWRLPNWIAYELTREETQGKEKRNNRFIADPLVKGILATNTDYTRSGYDKGHLAPAADMKWSKKAMIESFYFSNICPQHPELNRRKWKDLEEKTRIWSQTDSAIIVISGPIVDKHPQMIGKNQIVIPQKFFKVILSPFIPSPKAIGFLFNNQKSIDPLRTYIVTVDSIESLTGMDFFAPLPDELENRIESNINAQQWGL